MIIYDQYGIPRKTEDIRLVEQIEKLKKESGSNPWPVIEELFRIFKTKRLAEYKSHVFYIEQTRGTRRGKFAASNPDPVHGGILRYTLDIPEFVMNGIRFVYSPEELPMNRKFFFEFAKRFPDCQVAEKL